MPKVVNHEKQCRQIAFAACQAIARKGMEKTTMADIADQAGVTTGMITHYFRTKREILAAALRLIFERTEQRLKLESNDEPDSLFNILRETLPIDETRKAESAVWVSFWGNVTTDQNLIKVNRTLHEDAEELYARVIRTAWKESTEWPPRIFDQVCRSVLVFLNGLTASAITSPQSWPESAQFDALEQHLRQVREWARNQ